MHESVLKQDKIFCGYLLALIRPSKWKLDFHDDDFVGFLWVQNCVWPMITLWIRDLSWPWKLSMANHWEVRSIGLQEELLKCANGKILLDFLRSCWIWKYNWWVTFWSHSKNERNWDLLFQSVKWPMTIVRRNSVLVTCGRLRIKHLSNEKQDELPCKF